MRQSFGLWFLFITGVNIGSILITVVNCAPAFGPLISSSTTEVYKDERIENFQNLNDNSSLNITSVLNDTTNLVPTTTSSIRSNAYNINSTVINKIVNRVRWDQIKLLDEKNIINPDGSYEYRYSLQDGTEQDVKGTLKEVDGQKVYTVKGFYGFTFDDGSQVEVQYEADENGFRVISVKHAVDDRIGSKAVGSLLG